jgi:hypothetical protein
MGGAGVFPDWQDYSDTLERMNRVSDKWDSATTFAQFDELIRLACGELVDPNYVYDRGVDRLCREVAEREYAGDYDLSALRVMFAALGRPAGEYENQLVGRYGYRRGDWDGFFINVIGGDLVYSDQQFADPGQWTAMVAAEPGGQAEDESDSADYAADAAEAEPAFTFYPPNGLWYVGDCWYLPDKSTVVVEDPDITDFYRDGAGNHYKDGRAADLAEEHFLTGLRRWRRLAPNGTFEFYHDAAQDWFCYDPASDSWFDRGEWVRYEQVGAPAAQDPLQDAEARQQLDQRLADLRDTGLRGAIEAIRARGVSAGQMTDEQIRGLLDTRVMDRLASVGN